MAHWQKWVAEADPEESDGFCVLACVESNATLYVFVAGPPQGADAPLNQVLVHLPPAPPPPHPDQGDSPVAGRYISPPPVGAALRWRGQGGTGDRHDEVIVAKFDPPGDDVGYLDVTLSGTPGFASRLVRFP